jgi:hypothetical protein
MPSSLSRGLVPVLLVGMCAWVSVAQQVATVPAATSASVPRLVNYSGVLIDAEGRPLNRITGVTFLLYKEQNGGAPLWMETQNVVPGQNGHYVATLGITKPEGLPAQVFVGGEARWLAVQAAGQAEQPRVLLVAVPYALKAADAETIGGLPPSAFVLAAPSSAGAAGSTSVSPSSTPPTNPAVTGAGTAGAIPLWDSASDITNSILTQTGSGSTARLGVNIGTPSTTLDVKGTSNFRGTTTMPSAGLATASGGKTSYPLVFATSAYNSSAKGSVLQNFRWQAEPANNNSANAAGSLNLLFSSGTNTPAETGLSIASNGQLTFAAGQTFPGTGAGTITGVTAGSGLTGGGTTGTISLSVPSHGISNSMLAAPSLTVKAGTALTGGGSVALGGTTTLNVDTTKVPLLNAPNVFTANQTVNANLYVNGLFGTGVTLTGSAPTFMGAGNNPNESGSGYPLTVSGGSTAVGAPNVPGGDLILAAGNGNGLGGGGNVRLQAASPTFTGSQADSLVDRQFIAAAPINMGGQSGMSSYFMLNFSDFTAGAINVRFTIYAVGGSSQGIATGSCLFLAASEDPGVELDYSLLFSADHIDWNSHVNPECGLTFFQGSDGTLDGVYIVDSLDFDPSTLHMMYYQIENISGLPLTIQALSPNSADRVVPRADRRANALHPRVTMTIHR